jgi:hypothetical protein
MDHRPHQRLGIALALAGVLAAWAVPALAATCGVEAVTIGRADVVFVGTPTAVSAPGDRATFTVEEVWSGGDLPLTVEVSGEPGQWEMRPAGAQAPRYVVIAEASGDQLLVTNQCDVPHPSVSVVWEPGFAAARPASAHPPVGAATGSGPPVQLLIALAVLALIGAISAIAFRRTRQPAGQA